MTKPAARLDPPQLAVAPEQPAPEQPAQAPAPTPATGGRYRRAADGTLHPIENPPPQE